MALKTVKIEPGAAPAPESGPAAPAAPGATPAAKTGGGVRRKILLGVAAVAVLAAGWMGVSWFVDGRFNITTDNAQLRSDIARVTPKVEGYVAAIHVAENQVVKQGDLLIELEPAEFETRLAHAKAQLAQAEADAAQARARISVQRDTLAEARAARDAADATADLSSSDAKRLADLSAKGWYPKAKLEQAEAARRSADAQLTQADATITAQRSQLSSAQAAAESAEARVAAAKAEVEGAELELGRTKIRAPINGVVTKKDVIVGQILSPGKVAL
jgi:membrane fusion protein (multidrug efflux system)